MTRNENVTSTSSIWGRRKERNLGESQRKHLSDIGKTDGPFDGRKSSLFLRAAWQKRVAQCHIQCHIHSYQLYGNLAADIKGRSCCKWLVLWRNENVAPSPTQWHHQCDEWQWLWEIARHYWRLRKFARIAHMSPPSFFDPVSISERYREP